MVINRCARCLTYLIIRQSSSKYNLYTYSIIPDADHVDDSHFKEEKTVAQRNLMSWKGHLVAFDDVQKGQSSFHSARKALNVLLLLVSYVEENVTSTAFNDIA